MNRLLRRLYHRFLCVHCDEGAIVYVVDGREHHLVGKPRRRSLASVLHRV